MKTDLRILRTQKAIKDAFIILLSKHPYEKIAVQDIIDTALVNRATFYRHYSGKSDLAGKMIHEFKTQVNALIAERFSGEVGNLSEFVRHMHDKLYQDRHLMLNLCKIRTPRHHLYDDIHELTKRHFIAHATARGVRVDLDYQGEMFATMILESGRYFFEQDKPLVHDVFMQWREIADVLVDGE